MRLIESSVRIIPQDPGLEGIYKQCELAGRTAYKSEDRITEGSAKKFVEALMKLKHGAVLEHGTVYLTIPLSYHEEPVYFKEIKLLNYSCRKYIDNPYTCFTVKDNIMYVTTNLRVLMEND